MGWPTERPGLWMPIYVQQVSMLDYWGRDQTGQGKYRSSDKTGKTFVLTRSILDQIIYAAV